MLNVGWGGGGAYGGVRMGGMQGDNVFYLVMFWGGADSSGHRRLVQARVLR